MKKLAQLIEKLEAHIPNKNVKNHVVSKSSVGWQIDHVLIVINRITSQLKKSDPAAYKSEFNLKRWIVFTTNHIPRGKAKAPKLVNPETEATTEELVEKIALARISIAEFDLLHKNNYFRHPYFNDLNVKQTKKFLTMHTEHHLKIIQDLVQP
jgi:hypothetical protein